MRSKDDFALVVSCLFFFVNKTKVVTLLLLVAVSSGCQLPLRTSAEQDIKLTYDGYVENGDKQQRIEGTCSTDDTRTAVNCDLYNGLPDWTITEATIRVTWKPYSVHDVRDFRQRVSISPLTTASTSFRVGHQLPPDWNGWVWLVVGAKGIHAGPQ